MALQGKVDSYRSEGIEGDLATLNPLDTDVQLAGADVTVGRAVWRDANGKFVNTGTGAPVGIAMRTRETVSFIFPASASMVIPAGQPVTALVSADGFIKSTTNSTPGQKVFANNTTGVLSTAAAGATVAGSSESKFFVSTTTPAGTVFKVSDKLEK